MSSREEDLKEVQKEIKEILKDSDEPLKRIDDGTYFENSRKVLEDHHMPEPVKDMEEYMERLQDWRENNKEFLEKCRIPVEELEDYLIKEKNKYAIKEVVKASVEQHERICRYLNDTYKRKNKDYGDAFGKSLDKFGFVAAVTRMSDKMGRIETLYKAVEGSQSVVDESLEDTLLDLANYCIMSVMWLKSRKRESGGREEHPNSAFSNEVNDRFNERLRSCSDAWKRGIGIPAKDATKALAKHADEYLEKYAKGYLSPQQLRDHIREQSDEKGE